MRKFFQRATSIGPETVSPGEAASGGLFGWMRDERGSIMIETTLGFMVMMTMVLGIIECSMMAYTFSVMEDAAREGVRYATVHGIDSASCNGPSSGCDATAANVVSDVKAYAGTFTSSLSTMTVTVTYPDGASTATSRVKVALSCTYQPVFHFPGSAHLLQVSSSGRILY
jgi:Flp pilus assembly protein TadG